MYRLKDPSRNASKKWNLHGLNVANLFIYFLSIKKHSQWSYSLSEILEFSGLCVCFAEFLEVDFPEHIKQLVQREKESEEQEKRQREIERNTCKVNCMNILGLCSKP